MGATGSTGAVDVCIVDSGIEAGHPLVGPLASAVAVVRDGDEIGFVDDDEGDVCGHGTACAGIVRSLAPACRLHSVRVLGAGATGAGDLILAGLRHAIEAGHRVINLSLSTTKRRFAEELHELADLAYFNRTVIVASAHNLPVDSFPWRFASVISVGSHEDADPLRGTSTQALPWSSSHAASMSKSRGSAAGRSAARATASPLRTSQGLPRSCWRSTRSSRPSS